MSELTKQIDDLLNARFLPTSDCPLWCCIQLSCGEDEVRQLMVQSYEMGQSDVNKDLLEALEDCTELIGYLKELPFSPKLTQVIKECAFLANHAIQKAKLNK